MKTVRTHLKTKLIFLLILALTALAATAFSQDLSMTAQPYGDSSLINIDFLYFRDSAGMDIHTDEDLVEIISIGYTDDAPVVERITKIDQASDYTVTFYDQNLVFLRTKYGVTSILFVKDSESQEGFVMINGKLSGVFENGGISDDFGQLSADFFKDRVDWVWTTEYTTL